LFVLACCFVLVNHDVRISTTEDNTFAADAAEMESRLETGSRVTRVVFVIIGVVGGTLVLLRSSTRLNVDPLMAFCIVAMLAWCCVTSTFAAEPTFTARRVAALLFLAIGAFGLAKHTTLNELCWFAIVFLGLLVLIGVMAEIALGTFRPWSGEYRFAGTVHPNYQAVQLWTLMLASFAIWRRSSRYRLFLFLIILGAAILLLLTKSRTALGACAVGGVALWLVSASPRWKYLSFSSVVILGGTLMIAALVAGIDDADQLTRALLLGRDEDSGTLTGRLPLWQLVAQDITRHPWVGHGYNSYWNEDILADIVNELGWPAGHAHNAYLETVLNIGVIGLVLLLLTVFVGAARAAVCMSEPEKASYALVVGLIAFGMINALLESHMIVPFNFEPFLLGCAMMRMAFWESPPKKSQPIETPPEISLV
jgi:exopolysaccharide production protein ExoQ